MCVLVPVGTCSFSFADNFLLLINNPDLHYLTLTSEFKAALNGLSNLSTVEPLLKHPPL